MNPVVKKIRAKLEKHQLILGSILTLILIAGLSYSVYTFEKLRSENISNLETINQLNNDKADLLAEVRHNENIINTFQGEIQSIGTTVGNLKKLSETDEELLKKYSKVYFLNENFVPSRLSPIPSKYLYEPDRNLYIHTDVWPALQLLLDSASKDEHELLIASAYRSFGTQASLKSNYSVSYGSGANQFSADQGYSEHQLGTTVDLTTSEIGAVFSKFADSDAYLWLQDNAWKFGFVLSYPENNTYYKFEPWHWRYVGKALAKFLHEEKLNFYDVSQREIDKYLLNIFDE